MERARVVREAAPADVGGLVLRNGEAAPLAAVPVVPAEVLAQAVVAACRRGGRLAALTTLPGRHATPALLAVVAWDGSHSLEVLLGRLTEPSFPSLTPELPQAQAFEREIFEETGVRPEGHPWLKALREHPELRAPGGKVQGEGDRGGSERPRGEHPFFVVEGSSLHEVAVGPVHAGIIEPGHFRFQCAGEEVLHLEIHLGYQHRGVESLLLHAPQKRWPAIVESIAGDTVIGHSLAHCLVREALGAVEVPERAQALRALALELERLANHVGDLGALAGDVGFLPGAAYFGRLRGEFLNMLLALTGNRFGRGILQPGGVRFDLPPNVQAEVVGQLDRVEKDLAAVARLFFKTPSVMARMERTGALSRETAEALGLVGPAARACGLERDVRRDHPVGAYRHKQVPVAVAATGDVWARAMVRWLEVQHSLAFLRAILENLPDGERVRSQEPLAAERLAVGLVEGWRGEILHLAVTDETGSLRRYKVIDPSFHNWFGLAIAMRGNQISDFPLCNKSFNLSYAGHDL